MSKEKHVSKVILPPDCTLNGAFSAYCVKTVIIPEGTGNVVIGENAFLSCPNLEKVVFEAKNVTLGVGSFADCKKMTEKLVDCRIFSKFAVPKFGSITLMLLRVNGLK